LTLDWRAAGVTLDPWLKSGRGDPWLRIALSGPIKSVLFVLLEPVRPWWVLHLVDPLGAAEGPPLWQGPSIPVQVGGPLSLFLPCFYSFVDAWGARGQQGWPRPTPFQYGSKALVCRFWFASGKRDGSRDGSCPPLLSANIAPSQLAQHP